MTKRHVPFILLVCMGGAVFSAEPDSAYKRFDRSVEQYHQTLERLSLLQERHPRGQTQARDIRRLTRQLKEAESQMFNSAGFYLGDRRTGRAPLSDIRSLIAELLAVGERNLARKNFNDALYAGEKVIELRRDSIGGHLLMGRALLELGNRRTAADHARVVLELDKGNKDAHFILGRAKLQGGKVQAAVNAFSMGLLGRPVFNVMDEDRDLINAPVQAHPRGRSPMHFLAVGLGVALFGFLFGSWVWRRRQVVATATKAEDTDGGLKRNAVEAPSSEAEDLLAGKYLLEEVLDYGNHSQLWSALDCSLQRPVRVRKVQWEAFSSRESVKKNFMKSAQRIAALNHPNIVAIIEVLDQEDGLFLVSEFVGGQSVEDLKEGVALDQAMPLLISVCRALEVAHARGLCHRALIPAHIFITDGGHVKVDDFGLSRLLNEFEGRAYLPPEDVVTPAGDVFSLGACAYRLLCGRAPEGSLDFKGMPQALKELLLAAMSPELPQRVQTVSQFLERLEKAAS